MKDLIEKYYIENGSVCAAIGLMLTEMTYPKAPIEPKIGKTPSIEEVEVYLEKKKEYDNLMSSYPTIEKSAQENNSKIIEAIEDFIRKESGLTEIPKQYQDKVYSYAYQQGHSYGYCEVFNILLNLVEIFE